MRRRFIPILLALGVVCGVSVAAAATAPGQGETIAQDFITTMGNRAFDVMRGTQSGSEARKAEFARLLVDAMDFEALAMFTLGRYGRNVKGPAREEYTRLFTAHFIDVALQQLADTDATQFAILSTKQLPNGDVMVMTKIEVVGDPQPWEAGWRVRPDGAKPKIVDVFVQGASAGMHFRNRFQDWLGKAGVDGMIEKLRSLTKGSPNLALVSAN